ncbi:uncharacterized protein B0H18DRAFT_1033839 [Fomitopsis serialis]|uniref:uncharacterized protein n=1 Tax=Fomitopsis serialis TaxID=139415 RepID=UPI0020086B35|nr:uncharacterized protein B0H18DRAFT_1080478 [Neoantrodia serialis]XP_047888440.1 uncharacterized protein B0H18DRAFT_1033839 [Neoantrodia serialis]KAH9905097.1 hypothetical protein B0H18DRAFT_1080478 [Neoantrodia serialis]KAH9917590.1 hypothetical protein B0H18DRAFT_1033839 [Neoantrodia serialis]
MATGAAAASSSATSSSQPLLASGDWTKNLVQLAKTAELKKHALTLQLHTAHILSAHASLDQKQKAIQDVKEQKNKLESERARLLNCLREVNEDRDKADLMEATLNKECADLRQKIQALSDTEYATAKADVDRLRQELGQAPLPSLQQTLEEKSTQYLKELRLQTEKGNTSNKRAAEDTSGADGQPSGKRPRGRPKGSKTNKGKAKETAPTGSAGATPAPGTAPNSSAP